MIVLGRKTAGKERTQPTKNPPSNKRGMVKDGRTRNKMGEEKKRDGRLALRGNPAFGDRSKRA